LPGWRLARRADPGGGRTVDRSWRDARPVAAGRPLDRRPQPGLARGGTVRSRAVAPRRAGIRPQRLDRGRTMVRQSRSAASRVLPAARPGPVPARPIAECLVPPAGPASGGAVCRSPAAGVSLRSSLVHRPGQRAKRGPLRARATVRLAPCWCTGGVRAACGVRACDRTARHRF
jgi:hypothetical protein